MKKFFPALLAPLLLAFAADLPARACAACYNVNAGSKMGNAANWGIIAMAIIMFIMLGAIVAAGFYLNWRAKHPLPDYSELLAEDDDETQPLPDAS
jgi:hypothetical protein